MGIASSKNVSEMISEADIIVGTSVSQSQGSSVNSANVVSQICNNVSATVVVPSRTGDRRAKAADASSMHDSCAVAARHPNVFACAIEATRSGDFRIKMGDEDTNDYTGSQSYLKGLELKGKCNQSEENCNRCSNGEGVKGIWTEDDYDSCVSKAECAWARTARAAPVTRSRRTIQTHCVERCSAIEDRKTCVSEACKFSNGKCMPKDKIRSENHTATGCEIKNIKQGNVIDIVSKSMQDAAVTTKTSQAVKQGLEQAAKATVTGINFGAMSESVNVGAMIARQNISISNKIGQKCNSSSNAKNIVTQVCNDVSASSNSGSATGCSLSGIEQKATTKMANECIQKVVVDNEAFQKIDQQMKQLAISTTTGLDPNIFLIVIIVAIAGTFAVAAKGLSTMGGVIVSAMGAVLTLLGAAFSIISINRNGGFSNVSQSRFGCISKAVQTNASAGLNVTDGFTKTGNFEQGYPKFTGPSSAGVVRTKMPMCAEKSEEQYEIDETCPNLTSRNACKGLKYGEDAPAHLKGQSACYWDRTQCKPRWTVDNKYGWCFEEGEGSVDTAYDRCSSSNKCTAWYWHKKDDNYSAFEEVDALPDAFPNGGPFADGKCASQPCCDRTACFMTGNGNSAACRRCCPSSLDGGDSYFLYFNKKAGKNSHEKPTDYDWVCKRCKTGKEKPNGKFYLYERHITQLVDALPKDESHESNIEPFLGCYPGLESWGAVEMPRAIDLMGVAGIILLICGVLTVIAGTVYQMRHGGSAANADGIDGQQEPLLDSPSATGQAQKPPTSKANGSKK